MRFLARGGTLDDRIGTQRQSTGLAIGALACVVLSACGARWSDEQRAEVVARHSPGERASAAERASGSSTPESAVALDASGADGVGPGTEVEVGVGGTPSGPPAGPRPCEAPSTAPGVGAEELVVGSISTLTGPVAGLGATGAAAVRAYVAYKNSTGGVCGRKITLRAADDGADLSRFRSLVNELDPKVLGLVGGTAAGDAGGADLVETLGMPTVSATFSVEMGHASTSFDISPTFKDVNQAIDKYNFISSRGVTKAAIVTVSNALSRAEAVSQRAQMEASGISVVHYQEVPISTLSFDAPARAVANSGADYLLFIYDPGTSATMARSLAGTGYKGLKFAEYITAYGSDFIDLGGAATEQAIGFSRTAPNEDATPGPNQASFLRWMAQVAPQSKPDTFAADSWSAATAFFEGLEALPGPITRAALIDHLNGIRSFDAGGLLGPIDLGESASNGCGVWMQVVNQKWQRLEPASGFLC